MAEISMQCWSGWTRPAVTRGTVDEDIAIQLGGYHLEIIGFWFVAYGTLGYQLCRYKEFMMLSLRNSFCKH